MAKSKADTTTELVPPSEESSGLELDPGCTDQEIPASPITMMSERGRRNAQKAGERIDYKTSQIRRP